MVGPCLGRLQTNFTQNKSTSLPSQINALRTFQRYFETNEKYVILLTATVLHIMSLILIVTTAYMFVRHRCLRTAGHLVHLNLLLSDSMVLLSDWVLMSDTVTGCELYSMSFLVFGSSSIYTAVVIAYARYDQMKNRVGGQQSCLNKHPLIWLFAIWIASVLASIFPIISKAQQVFESADEISGYMCFFTTGIAYERIHQPITFLLLVILAPAVIMSFCYIRIYQNVRRARITRWLNQAAHLYNTHTRIIKGHPRRANVISTKQMTSQAHIPSNTISDREKHIIFKGLFSVASQLLFWVPFGIIWLLNTGSVFQKELVLQQIYIMVLAKFSVVTNISHYISFNVKFRKLYVKSIIHPLRKICCCKVTMTTIHDGDISHISQSNTPHIASATSGQADFSDNRGPSTLFTLQPITEADTLASTNNSGSHGKAHKVNNRRRAVSLALPSLPYRHFRGSSSVVFPARISSYSP